MQLTVNTKHEKTPLGDLFGIFFEDLNHAADGGLYAELVQNRSFEFCKIDNPEYDHLTGWERMGTEDEISLEIEDENPFCRKNPHYLVMGKKSAEEKKEGCGGKEGTISDSAEEAARLGVRNTGFCGIPLKAGAGYDFAFYARKLGSEETSIQAAITGEAPVYGIQDKQEFVLTESWTKYECSFTATKDTAKGCLEITLGKGSKAALDFVSLFPKDTYKGRKNGLRKDLAELLEEIHPKFMRFPGGCLVHDGSLNAEDRDSQYRWKNTIGPVEERPARRSNWRYNQTLGLGYFEYFQFCEDIGAKPLPVLPGGYDPHHDRCASIEEKDGKATGQLVEFIQDALDLIEFANGDTDTVWGAKRAALGHPEPFHLEYIGIGNEEVGDPFFERYPYFHRAIKEKYPKIKIIGTSGPFAGGGEFEKGWRCARENGTDLVDEHYYQSPEWFVANHHRYDTYPRDGVKVFLGEYASHGNTWYNALCEASYMIGLQNNADCVGLACYAPLFCNVNYVNWQPDMIWFDNKKAYRTPNYHVQKLFTNHQGDMLLDTSLENVKEGGHILGRFPDRLTGDVAVFYGEASARYTDIVIRNEDTGEEITCKEAVIDKEHPQVILGHVDWVNYTIRMKAQELDGYKGLRIAFGQEDEKNRTFWLFGGWENKDSFIGEDINGDNSVLSQNGNSVVCGQIYDMEIRIRGRRITTYIDGEQDLDTVSVPIVVEPIYTSVTKENSTGDVIVKLVNLEKEGKQVELTFPEETEHGWKAQIFQMAGFSTGAVNSLDEPDAVTPKVTESSISQRDFTWEVAPQSLCILRLHQ